MMIERPLCVAGQAVDGLPPTASRGDWQDLASDASRAQRRSGARPSAVPGIAWENRR